MGVLYIRRGCLMNICLMDGCSMEELVVTIRRRDADEKGQVEVCGQKSCMIGSYFI